MHDESYSFRKKILVVDDDPTNLRYIKEILQDIYKVYAAPSGQRAVLFLEHNLPDLILLDIEMPHMNGYEVISRLKADERWAQIPVVFLTALEGRDKEQLAFKMGAVDYILKPISSGVLLSRLSLHLQLESYKKDLEQLVEIKTAQLQKTQDSILDILSNVTAYRDNETGAHIKRTTYFTQFIVESLQQSGNPDYEIDNDYAQKIIKSSKLHDIGKVAVPDGILLKPGKLTGQEFELIKQHTVLGGEILQDAIRDLGDESSFLTVAKAMVVDHHEWWDGSGYPQGLAGSQISLEGRIMAISDVYDALVSERPYKAPFTHEKAMEIIMEDSGTHFDPHIISICAEAFGRFPEIVSTYRDENYQLKMLNM